MRANKFGRIVNISSTSAYGNPGQVNYSASKAGVLGITKTLARELGGHNITVNAILPGNINTDMLKAIPEENRQYAIMMTPLKRLGDPSEIASVAAFFASDDASYVTGTELLVCGGFLTT